ncbi:hypothetical protein [Streptomyces melanogenes]|uniref:hypothetical protein n=1 Tax=Streptomyces melanogenes TaxID=67326 RepID=UPI0037BD8EA7
MKLTVVGCGYLSATRAACTDELGHEVLGMDSDMGKVAVLNSGKASLQRTRPRRDARPSHCVGTPEVHRLLYGGRRLRGSGP